VRVVVVGGGIVGLATAYKLTLARPSWRVIVLEKEREVCRHQSGHNSGVLHAGLYYAPGSAKARLAVSGIREMTAFARAHDIPHEICGKVVVATSDDELSRLDALEARGRANGLTGLRRLNASELRAIEPRCAGIAALHVPEEGIIDYPAVCAALVRLIQGRDGRVETGHHVTRLEERGTEWIVEAAGTALTADFVITCAGLHADRVAALAGEPRATRIVPFRGEYYLLGHAAKHLVRNLIYPVPNPAFPFLGVHFTRMIRGGVEAGPNAVLAFAREGYRKGTWSLRDFVDAVAFPGLWRFVARHARTSAAEVRRSLSKHVFAETLRRLVPDLRDEDLEPGGSGVRAMAMTGNGRLVEDFALVRRERALHVLNAPSPAATASLAIAEEIVRLALA
jgi:(S)-2-hydroxyglutarate dehydrogenase